MSKVKSGLNVFIFLLVFAGVFVSCKTVRKVAVIQDAITKKDTNQTIIITEKPKVDSAMIIREIMAKVEATKIDFKTFNAKIKIDYESAQNKDTYTAYLSMVKDSVIYMRIRGTALGISAEGMQVKINRDSVILVNKIGNKYVQIRKMDYLQETTGIPFDFSTLQDMLIGNPVFLDHNIVSYKEGNDALLVLMAGSIFKHLITLTHNDFTITHSKLDDIDMQRNRTCDISFSNYLPLGNFHFAAYRKIVVAEKSKLDVNLDFKEYALNEPLKYSFDVPKNYKRK